MLHQIRSNILAVNCTHVGSIGRIVCELLAKPTFYHHLISCQHMAQKLVQIPRHSYREMNLKLRLSIPIFHIHYIFIKVVPI